MIYDIFTLIQQKEMFHGFNWLIVASCILFSWCEFSHVGVVYALSECLWCPTRSDHRSEKCQNDTFWHHAFYTLTNPYFFVLSPVSFSSSSLLIILNYLYAHPSFFSPYPLCVLFLSIPSPSFLFVCLSVSLSSSSGSPSSQSLHVRVCQRHLLDATLPAFGSGQDTTADLAEQCQARVCVHMHIHKTCVWPCKQTHSTQYISKMPLALSISLSSFFLTLTHTQHAQWDAIRHLWKNPHKDIHTAWVQNFFGSLNLLLWLIYSNQSQQYQVIILSDCKVGITSTEDRNMIY